MALEPESAPGPATPSATKTSEHGPDKPSKPTTQPSSDHPHAPQIAAPTLEEGSDDDTMLPPRFSEATKSSAAHMLPSGQAVSNALSSARPAVTRGPSGVTL